MVSSKRNLGQYFTKGKDWLTPQVDAFITEHLHRGVVDPFAGGGDLLKHFEDTKGFDIDPSLGWEINDGLKSIPATDRLMITNPPYLAKNSAKRRGLDGYKYFQGNTHQDLYLLALEKCLEKHDKVVAIIPESFFNKKDFREYIVSFTILEDNPFEDTEVPTCVVCFDKDGGDYKVYKGSTFIGLRSKLDKHALVPENDVEITFNTIEGNLGVLGYDVNKLNAKAIFCKPEVAKADKDIKISNRNAARFLCERVLDSDAFIKEANKILAEHRALTQDVLLPPFKSNNAKGERRRSLNFSHIRAITEKAVRNLGW